MAATWRFDSGRLPPDVNQMQSDVFNEKAEWLEVEEKIKNGLFWNNGEPAVSTNHLLTNWK